MPKFRKKPVTIEAVQWNGDNWQEISNFINMWATLTDKEKQLSIMTIENRLEKLFEKEHGLKCTVAVFMKEAVEE
jgi:hypothetical protein